MGARVDDLEAILSEIERIQQMVSPPAPLTLEPKPIHADVFLTCRARMVVVESQGTSGEVPLECVGGLSEGWPMKKVRQTIQCLIFFSSSSPDGTSSRVNSGPLL